MFLRTGIDIVEIDRFVELLNKHSTDLTQKFFTEVERSHAAGSDQPARCYASFWAIREAAYKVGGGSLWQHYSVEPSETGFELCVSADLFDSADCAIPENTSWDTSLALTDDEVVATVIGSHSLSVT